MNLPRPLRGIITPMLTPLVDPDNLDVGALGRLIEHLLLGGVSGLFILGSTGEAPGLSYRLRKEVIDRACSIVNGRRPVLVGITDTSSVESLGMAEYSAPGGSIGSGSIASLLLFTQPGGVSRVPGAVRSETPVAPVPL